ncbi:MAG: sulfotransferase family 2 domain-containing protein [Halioglobus sp.]
MVISHKYRYVFVQSMKTASTAIASELCENYDGEMILKKHATIDDFRAQASPDELTYFSFSGVRNPLDVVVSRFELRKGGDRNMHRNHRAQTRFIEASGGDFNAFFHEFLEVAPKGPSNLAYVPVNWRNKSFQSLDYIYKYEDLAREFATILEKIGASQLRPLPVENRTRDKGHFLSYYSSDTRDSAYRLFYDYLQRWGYDIPARITHRVEHDHQVREQLEGLRAELAASRTSLLVRTLFRGQARIHQRIYQLLELLSRPGN